MSESPGKKEPEKKKQKKKQKLWCCAAIYESPMGEVLMCPLCGFEAPSKAECLGMLYEMEQYEQHPAA